MAKALLPRKCKIKHLKKGGGHHRKCVALHEWIDIYGGSRPVSPYGGYPTANFLTELSRGTTVDDNGSVAVVLEEWSFQKAYPGPTRGKKK